MPRRPRSGTAAALVFALLVLATVGAFAWAQRVKRDPLILDRVKFAAVPVVHPQGPPVRSFTPNGDCRYDLIRIRFRVTQSDHATVQVVKPHGGAVVATLARDRFLKRYHYHTFFWNGRESGGGEAPSGRYKLRVKMLGLERILLTPGTIRLYRVPPRGKGACKGAVGKPGSGAQSGRGARAGSGAQTRGGSR